METVGPRSTTSERSPVLWSLLAGVYAFVCGVLVSRLLGPIVTTMMEVLTLSPGSSTLLVPGSVAVIAAGVWWAVVERPAAYTYVRGVAAGIGTVLATTLFWMLLVSLVYGPLWIPAVGVVILTALAVAVPAGCVWGLSAAFARRHLGGGRSG